MPDAHPKSARRGPARAANGLRHLSGRVPTWAWLAAMTLVATVLVASQTLRMNAWLTMTDELQYVRLALSVSQDHSLLPRIHGAASGSYSQLYPVLLAPVYALFENPTAFKVAHVFNALAMSSTVFPAYLLTRAVVSRRAAAYAVAALSVAIPWMLLALLVWTDPLAYPVFVWTVLALQRALVEPSWRRDAAALAAVALAFLTRTQLAVLGVAFPAAVLLHECGYALTRHGLSSAPAALREGVVRAVTRHWLLLLALAVASLGVLSGPLAGLLGPYRSTVGNSSLFPPGVSLTAEMHLALVGVGIGVVPVLLGLAWLPLAAARPTGRAAHAFVALALVVGLALFIQASSFVKLYGAGAPNDRYFFYVVPLFLVAAAAYLVDGPRHWLATLGATALFAWVATRASYGLYAAYSISPVAAFHPVLNGRIAQVTGALGIDGVSTAEGVRAIVIVLGVALSVAVRLVPMRLLAPLLAAGLLAFGIGQTGYVFRKVVPVQSALMPRADWVDRSGGGQPAAMAVAPVFPGIAPDQELTNQLSWWNLEFWNSSVRRSYGYKGAGNYTGFPSRLLAVDPGTGRLRGIGLPRLMVTPVRRADLGLAGRELDRNGYLKLIDLGPSPRARWAVQGLTTPGSGVVRNGSALLRVYPRSPGTREGVRVTIALKSPPALPRPQRFRIVARPEVRSGRVRPRSTASSRFRACLGPGARTVRIASGGAGTTLAGLILESVRVAPDPAACPRGG